MVPRKVFYERMEQHCKQCQHWANVCLLGHQLASPEGCPEKKFAPIQGAQYAVPREAVAPPVLTGCCNNSTEELKALTWPEVLAHFAESMTRWVAEGCPLVKKEAHAARYSKCKSNECGQFRSFYCHHCKCIAYTKAKVATETCPKGMWPTSTSQG